MNIIQKILFASCIGLSFVSTHSFATGPRVTPSLFMEDIEHIYGLNFPPYINQSGNEQGVIIDIVKTILKTEKIEAALMVLPSKNMLKYYFSEENALAVVGYDFNFNQKAQAKAQFIPILSVDEFYLYYKPNFPEGLIWSGDISAFSGKVYGTRKGENIDKYKAAGIKVKYGRTRHLLAQLKAKKLDFIRITEGGFKRLPRLLGADVAANLIRLEPSVGKLSLGIAFNTQNPQGRIAAKKFTTGLKALKESGLFAALVKKNLGN